MLNKYYKMIEWKLSSIKILIPRKKKLKQDLLWRMTPSHNQLPVINWQNRDDSESI